eukprot:CAMPEP_0118875526 /NCGR_PEP_ID=MMETSP1163-20130328/16569_1 /TAXON_ID=124430 /ORGANISM="Phaeomonas parva, Strain CCMP2877" /LENGTH=41 /DNA_ID= /DNA_START= /DNA_END= /DNA_ORIENTATION=
MTEFADPDVAFSSHALAALSEFLGDRGVELSSEAADESEIR